MLIFLINKNVVVSLEICTYSIGWLLFRWQLVNSKKSVSVCLVLWHLTKMSSQLLNFLVIAILITGIFPCSMPPIFFSVYNSFCTR